ncbi:MAG TPA: HAD family hydrolase [Gemmataceae bacterium]|jgi:hydroxymethylpyrimidine pyrophosphatase-like HAD family hydrolase|nr:HAD family hydrolase [Gemmataceae bacterium]
MRFLALATDYDGTIAHDGVVDAATLDALRRLKATGRRLIMVTGRELDDLFRTFDHCDLFDRLVVENGALVYRPDTQEVRQIAPKPPALFVDRLRSEGVPISVGRSIVATVEPHEHAVLGAIRDLGIEWHVIFNKGSVMALPSGVTKATGLEPVLEELALRPDQVIGVGDAENDHAFLSMCGLSVAVANALPAVKDTADLVTPGARGAGVTELIDRLLTDEFAGLAARGRAAQPVPPT